jgi:hypothetical protein
VSKLVGPWAGRIYGTNTGKVFVELEETDGRLTGTARINDESLGIAVFEVTGSAGDDIELALTPKSAEEGVDIAAGHITGRLSPDGTLRGRWETVAGTAGTFVLFPHSSETPEQALTKRAPEPEQIFNRVAVIGSTRLFRDDVVRVFEIARRDFADPSKLIVTYELHGNEITEWADDFVMGMDRLTELRTFKLSIQEPGKGSVSRMVNIDLMESGDSTVRVSGPDETWVVGKVESMRKAISGYQNSVVTNYKKYGLNLNFFLFVGMLILVPSIQGIPRRIIFAAVVLILVRILFAIHSKMIPNTLVLIRAKPKGPFALAWPTLLSWVMAVTSTVVAGLIFWYLTK